MLLCKDGVASQCVLVSGMFVGGFEMINAFCEERLPQLSIQF
jgi:hypothetical protein